MFIAKRTATVLFPAVLLVASTVSWPALAQFGGYYAELSAGKVESTGEALPPSSDGTIASELNADSDTGAFTAGWRFNDNISVEAGYVHYGTFSGRGTSTDSLLVQGVDPLTQELVVVEAQLDVVAEELEYEVRAFAASVLGNWLFRRRWSLYGELGLAAWDVESELQGTLEYSGGFESRRRFSLELSDSGSSFFYSAGLHYRFNLSYGVRLEYQAMKIESEIFNSDADLQSVTLGLRLYY